jgi:hypothetical protein
MKKVACFGAAFFIPFLAGEVGFEPTHHGVKVRCLTAWLFPNAHLKDLLEKIKIYILPAYCV